VQDRVQDSCNSYKEVSLLVQTLRVGLAGSSGWGGGQGPGFRLQGPGYRAQGIGWVLGVGCWVLGVGCWVLGVGCWVLGVEPGCWVLSVEC